MNTTFDQVAATDDQKQQQTVELYGHEVEQFRRWRDDNIRSAALAEGRAEGINARLAAEQEAEGVALKQLETRGLALKDLFGHASTQIGRNAAIQLHRSGVGKENSAYSALRRIARREGLVT